MPTPLIPNIGVFQKKLAGFPVATYRRRERARRRVADRAGC